MRFQEARPKALELARADKEQENGTGAGSNKKRKLEDTDTEDEEDVRQTRSRQTRRSRRNAGSNDAPVEVPDSGDGGDEDFMPEGMAKCPICNEAMKQELVFNHLDVCTGQSSSQGRNTRSKYVTSDMLCSGSAKMGPIEPRILSPPHYKGDRRNPRPHRPASLRSIIR